MPLPRPQLPLALAWKSETWTGQGPNKPTALWCRLLGHLGITERPAFPQARSFLSVSL